MHCWKTMLHLVYRVDILVKTGTFRMFDDKEGRQTQESLVSL